MCGLLALLTAQQDAAQRQADVTLRCAASGTAAPTRPGPGTTMTSCSGSTGCPSSTSTTPTSRCAGVRRTRRSATRWPVQRRDLQLPRAACGAARELRGAVRHRRRHRGHRRGLPLLGRGRGAAAARHVRVPDLGHAGAGRCSARGTRSASSRCSSRPARRGVAFSSEKKSLLELLDTLGASTERWTAGAAALPDAAVRARAGDAAHAASGGSSPAPRSPSPPVASSVTERYFTPMFRPRRSRRGRAEQRCTTDIADVAARLGGQAHARPTSPSARSSPAASTPP